MSIEESRQILENYIRDNCSNNGLFILPAKNKIIYSKQSFDVAETISNYYTFLQLTEIAYKNKDNG